MILISPDLEPDDDIELIGLYQPLTDAMARAVKEGDLGFLRSAAEAIVAFCRDSAERGDELRHPPFVFTGRISPIFIFKCENNGNTYRYSNDQQLMGDLTGYE